MRSLAVVLGCYGVHGESGEVGNAGHRSRWPASSCLLVTEQASNTRL